MVTKVERYKKEFSAKRRKLQKLSKQIVLEPDEYITDNEIRYIIVTTEDVSNRDTESIFWIAREIKRSLHIVEKVVGYTWGRKNTNYSKRNDLYNRVKRLRDELEE